MAKKARQPQDSATPASGPDAIRAAGFIELEGVRVHNLRGLNLKIRHQSLTAICGVSGSGKSSLAFDTLYAEGQRRYIETFSPSARQFLDRIERPAVDRISGLPPAIAIRQQQRNDGLRSTLGTRTEIIDYLRVIFARAGETVCPNCKCVVRPMMPETAAELIINTCIGRLIVVSDVATASGELDRSVDHLIRSGLTRAIVDGRTVRLEEIDRSRQVSVLTVAIDRLKVDASIRSRLAETLATAMSLGNDRCRVLAERMVSESAVPGQKETLVDEAMWQSVPLSRRRECGSCGRSFPEPSPEQLSFTSPLGACSSCEGTGIARQRAVKSGKGRSAKATTETGLSDVCPACHGTRLQPDAHNIQLAGRGLSDVATWECGELLDWLRNLNASDGSSSGDKAVASMVLTAALRPAYDQALRRLKMIVDLGLGYLSLDRAMSTLSGGEAQRASLTAALGSGLINTLYVLDEPTAGLHASDTQKVFDRIRELQQRGNTVVVVEHDPAVILAADDVIEIGPGAGEQGGSVVFHGKPQELLSGSTATGLRFRKYLEDSAAKIEAVSGEATRTSRAKSSKSIRTEIASAKARVPEDWLDVRGVECHNIHGLDIRIPLGVFCAVVGVSGSGKSSLIADSLYPELCQRLNLTPQRIHRGGIAEIIGVDHLENVLLLDQSPIPRSRRSIPATWIGVFDDIRVLLAETHEAKKRNFSRAMFSFNAASGGRCPVCEGRGIVTVAMQFLADIETPCEECHGQRFRPDVLEVRYRDRSIDDILNMTADDAFVFFNGHHRIQQRLNAMRQAGLAYIRLGQPLSTISGGEAQRLRIAALLAGLPLSDGDVAAENRKTPTLTRAGRTMFLLDEPSAGLHLQDLDHLVSCIDFLVQTGHSVIVVDHDDALTSGADWIIELGPGPGKLGGRIVSSNART